MTLNNYIQGIMHQATYKLIDDDTYFAEIPSFDGLWASAQTIEAVCDELAEVLAD